MFSEKSTGEISVTGNTISCSPNRPCKNGGCEGGICVDGNGVPVIAKESPKDDLTKAETSKGLFGRSSSKRSSPTAKLERSNADSPGAEWIATTDMNGNTCWKKG